MPQVSGPANVSNRKRDRRVLNLNGKEFVYETADLPPAPAIHFSDRIDSLFEEWESSMLLTVKEQGIPIKHWSDLYKFGTKSAVFSSWRARKSEWMQWSVRQLRMVDGNTSQLTVFSSVFGQRAEALQLQRRFLGEMERWGGQPHPISSYSGRPENRTTCARKAGCPLCPSILQGSPGAS